MCDITDRRRYILILLGNAYARAAGKVAVSLTFLRAGEESSRDRVSANLGRALGRGYRCLVHYDTERAKENGRGG